MNFNKKLDKILNEMKFAEPPDPVLYEPPGETGISASVYMGDQSDIFQVRRAIEGKGGFMDHRSDSGSFKEERWIVPDEAGNNKEVHTLITGNLPIVELINSPGYKGLLTGKEKQRTGGPRKGSILKQIIFPVNTRWVPENQIKPA